MSTKGRIFKLCCYICFICSLWMVLKIPVSAEIIARISEKEVKQEESAKIEEISQINEKEVTQTQKESTKTAEIAQVNEKEVQPRDSTKTEELEKKLGELEAKLEVQKELNRDKEIRDLQMEIQRLRLELDRAKEKETVYVNPAPVQDSSGGAVAAVIIIGVVLLLLSASASSSSSSTSSDY